MIVHAERVVTSNEILTDTQIQIEGGKIRSLGRNISKDPDLHASIAVPGFVDVHCHGGNGHHFFDEDDDAAYKAATFHLEHGTTSLIASFVAAPISELKAQIQRLVSKFPLSNVVGIHLEGPYLSEIFCGAHNPAFLSSPSVTEVESLLDHGAGWIKMITIAPELDGALDTISYLRSRGVIAAIGHSDADEKMTTDAVDAGAEVVTHFFSAMRPIHHRIGGMTLTTLFDERVHLELIVDNVHISPNAVAIPLHFASERVLAITDALSVAGQPDGDYMLGTTEVELRNGVAKIKGKDLLAGSTLTMNKSFKSAITRLGMDPNQAVRAFATRPAQLFGLTEVGDIRSEKDADLVLLDQEYNLKQVIFKGSPV